LNVDTDQIPDPFERARGQETIFLLAHNLGWTHWWNWNRFWPVLLMVIGMA
jgi:hypothetical protein